MIKDSLELLKLKLNKKLRTDIDNLFGTIVSRDTIHKKSSDLFEIDTLNFQVNFRRDLVEDSLIISIKPLLNPDLLKVNESAKHYIDSLRNAASTKEKESIYRYDNLISNLKIFDYISVNRPDTSSAIESIYNKWYTMKEPDRGCNTLVSGFTAKEPKQNVFKYKLKGKISIRVTFAEDTKSGAAEIKYAELLNTYKIKKDTMDLRSKFPYSFETVESETFYLDKYYHLWNKTIAARSIDNKIFLQRHE
jgi:hypothetical protein